MEIYCVHLSDHNIINYFLITVRGYPKTDTETPLMLFSIENNNVSLPAELELPKFPSFPNIVSVENDASLAKVFMVLILFIVFFYKYILVGCLLRWSRM